MKKMIFFLGCLSFSLSAICQTTIVLQPGPNDGKDAFLSTLNPTTNYGSIAGFLCAAWTYGGVFGTSRSIVQFDLNSIPAGATITNARLSLYKDPTPSHVGHSGDNGAYLKRVLFDWNESTINYNNQPMTTPLHQVSIAASTNANQDYPDINVTQLVIDMVNNPSQSFGFMLQLITEQTFRSLVFASSDHVNATKRPKLTITYTQPCNTINGNLSYTNTASTPLHGFKVFLLNENNVNVDSTVSDSNGNFSFTVCTPGNYSILPHGEAPEHGINSYDALIAMKYFSGMLNLEGLFATAGDVDNNGSINAIDGQLIVHRFIGRIPTFPAGDWNFENPTFAIPITDPVNLSIKGLCVGDLNASWYY